MILFVCSGACSLKQWLNLTQTSQQPKAKKQSILALEWQVLVLSFFTTDTKKDLYANLIKELITVTGIL